MKTFYWTTELRKCWNIVKEELSLIVWHAVKGISNNIIWTALATGFNAVIGTLHLPIVHAPQKLLNLQPIANNVFQSILMLLLRSVWKADSPGYTVL